MEGTAQAQALVAEVQAVLAGELTREVAALCTGDLRTIEARVQSLLRRVGGALLAGLAQLRVASQAGERPATRSGSSRRRAAQVAGPSSHRAWTGNATTLQRILLGG